MSLAGVTHCPSCQAVMNARWTTCLACLHTMGSHGESINKGWLAAWQELAELTEGVTKTNPRFHPVCEALEQCDRAFAADDWATFHRRRIE